MTNKLQLQQQLQQQQQRNYIDYYNLNNNIDTSIYENTDIVQFRKLSIITDVYTSNFNINKNDNEISNKKTNSCHSSQRLSPSRLAPFATPTTLPTGYAFEESPATGESKSDLLSPGIYKAALSGESENFRILGISVL